MSPKKKRSKQTARGEPKKSPEGPFFRPFADLSEQVNRNKSAEVPKQPAASPPKPKRPAKVQPPAEDPDDLFTFERLMCGVEPLDTEGARRVPKSQAEAESGLAKYARTAGAQQEVAEQEALDRLHALVEEGSRFEVQDDGRRIEGRRRGVDGGLVRRMRHGEVPVDATLDLHGMRADQARQAVEAFVRDRRAKGDRVVLVVHGRDRNAPGQQPVLRGEVAAWLSEGAASKHVSAFLTATAEQGGEGAMSVLLAQPSETHRGMR